MIELIKDNIPDIRFLYDLKDVLYDQEWLKTAPNFEVYYMYRGLSQNAKDKETAGKNNLRYDITIISPRMLGKEFPKTLGHIHAKIEGTNFTYPEIYELLDGEGDFLLQLADNGKILDVYAVKVKKGEKIIIPPNYAHFMLNVMDTDIIMANWFEAKSKSDYAPIKEKHGACYYAISSATVIPNEPAFSPSVIPSRPQAARNLNYGNATNIKWIKNQNYSEIPELKIYRANDFLPLFEKLGIDFNKPMYGMVDDISKLDFLKSPQKYEWIK